MSKRMISKSGSFKVNRHQQQGATLIIVLLIILLLSIIATVSLRNSQTSLDMTTASQVQQLLTQSSDVPLAKLELSNIENQEGETSTTVLQSMAIDNNGPIGLLKTEGRKNAEYILCYMPVQRKGLYAKGEHRIILDVSGATAGFADGYCKIDSDSKNFYTSSRKTVATQVAMTRPTVNESVDDDVAVKPLSTLNTGMDVDTVGLSEAAYFRSYVTSIVPTLADSKEEDISACLKKPIGGLSSEKNSQELCLRENAVPLNVQVQDYAYNLEVE